jgi:LuxR family maltose regulon positive regulatory protein
MQQYPLLQTKLYIPPIRTEVVSRLHLLARLDEGLRPGCKLILVSAPAGFGKTTLVVAWIHHLDIPVAWLSLDREDNDLARLLHYLVAALQTVDPATGKETMSLLQLPQLPSLEGLLTPLVNELSAASQPIVLVLDDVHEMTTAPVYEGLLFLLHHLPPHVHMVIITRTDPPWPLARMRTRREMIELRAQDLRFTPDEVAFYLRNTTGLPLTAESIGILDARTEGWIAGLQMAVLALRAPGLMPGSDVARAEALIQDFSSSHRFVLDYLVEEVLDRQDAEIQSFLLHTSILDRLTAPLCDAVLLNEEGGTQALPDSQSILIRLERANLFLVPLDTGRSWYRYHQLFADLLRKRLHETFPDQVPKDHGRASTWYEQQDLIHQAVMHAHKAGDHHRLIYLIERYAGQVLVQGDFVRVGHWIELLPEETTRTRPLLCLLRAWTLLGDPKSRDSAVSWFEHGLVLSAADPHPVPGLGETTFTDHEIIKRNALLFRVNLAVMQQADAEEIIDLCMEALKILPEEAVFERSAITFYLAQAYHQLHNGGAATRTLAQARQFGLAVEGYSIALAASGLQAFYAWERGDLNTVAHICREAIATLVQPTKRTGSAEQASETMHPYACGVYVALGRTLTAWNEFEEAEPLLLRGVQLAEQLFESGMQVVGYCDLARIYWMRGDFQQAHTFMDKAVQVCRWDPKDLHALRVRIWLAQAEQQPEWLDKAIQWADEYSLTDPGDDSCELQSLVRVRIAQYRVYGNPDLRPLLGVLDRHLESLKAKSSRWQVEVVLLKALLLQAMGQVKEAMAPLSRALSVAKTTGRVLVFLEHGLPMEELLREAERLHIEMDYARQILAAFDMRGLTAFSPVHEPPLRVRAQVQAGLVEPLTERELDVLRLMFSTLSLREIADQLYLSINTVRTHCKHIYAKLDVHSRIEATTRAQELDLL